MKKAELKEVLAQCSNVIELVRKANDLKAAGESEIMVNRCVTELRKDIFQKAVQVKRLKRVAIVDTSIQQYGIIKAQIDSLATPRVVTDGENVLM